MNDSGSATSHLAHVLLVEQDTGRRQRLNELLTHHGLTVVPVPTAERALAILKHDRPGLILTNAKLPDASGLELAQRIRAFDAHIPIMLFGDAQANSAVPTADCPIQQWLSDEELDQHLLMSVDRWLNTPAETRGERWPGTVLVVDDEPKIREILGSFLGLHGFTVKAVATGEEAIAQCQRTQPSVVLLDINLPGLNGLEALKQLKFLHPTLPVLMITGLEEEEMMEQALALGAQDYVLKPFNLDYLETALLSKMLLGKHP